VAGTRSDIDVVVTPAEDRRLDLFGGIQTLLEESSAGTEVDMVFEPIRRPGLRVAVKPDRIDAF
jgi:predicted nucleotidyltransferase